MYKISHTLVFIAFVSLFSCQEKAPSSSAAWSLEPSGEKIQLALDDSTSNVSVGLEYFESAKPLLFNVNWNANSLQVFDLLSQTLEKEIAFEREGDQGARLGHFHVHNLDSIFLFPERSPFIILTDTSGLIKNRLRIKLPEGYPMIFVHNSYYLSPPIIQGKELIVKVRIDARPSDISQEQLNDKKLLAAINLEDGSTRLLPFGFPNDYLDTGQKQLEYSVASKDGKIAVSFMGDHRVYSGDFGEDLRARSASSQFLDETMPTFAKDVDGRGFTEYFFAKSRYESLVYDPYRKVYYRFAFPTVAVESDEQLTAMRTKPGVFVVMVLDEDLKVLTERKFEAGTYLPSNFFVGEKGLYLSTNHPDNPENVEDQLSFELIRLQE